MLKEFKQKVADSSVIGCFIKTPHPTIIEILGQSDLDYVILDAEHAPFDRTTIDSCMIASRAAQLPVLVRVPDASWILNVLDAGAAGIVVPHVTSAVQAEEIVAASLYCAGGRGFAGTTRAANFGLRGADRHYADTEHEITVVCQIEDVEGLENSAAISAVEGVDALLVGRADLAVSMQCSFGSEEVQNATSRVLGVSNAATGLYCNPGEDLSPWKEAGARFFTVGSDHTLLREGGRTVSALIH